MIKSLTKRLPLLLAVFLIAILIISASPSLLSAAMPTEIVSLRTENSKTYDLGNGHYSTDISVGAVHYKDNYNNSSEQWKDIDLTWQGNQITTAPYILTVNPDNYSLTMYDKKTGSTTSLALSTIGNKSATKITKVTTKNKMAFSSVATDTDIEIVVENTRVQFKRILKSDKAPTDAVFGLSQSGTGIVVTSQARYTNTNMNDAKIPVITSKNGGLLTETIDKIKVTKYPVEIDPTLDLQVSANTDDCYDNGTTTVTNSGANIAWGKNGGVVYDSGIRFLNVTVPNGATITSAYVTFTCYTGSFSATTCNANCYGEDADNAATYSNHANFVGRALTAAVAWNSIGTWNGDVEYSTPSLITPVTTITARVGWVSGNAMAFQVKDNGSSEGAFRPPWDYSGSTAKAAKLHIEYTSTTPYPTVTTNAVLDIEETTATYNGTITSGTSIDQRGFAWGTTSNATLPGNETPPASYTTNWTDYGSFGTGNFAYNASGLTSADKYYERAYAHNTTGWGWGGEVSFFTKPNEPTGLHCVSGDKQVALDWTKATVGTGATMYTYIRYKAGSYPVDITDGTFSYNGTLSANTTAGLTNGTAYYFVLWSWAHENGASQWSDLTANCTCTPAAVPSVTTIAATLVEETTTTVSGNVTSLNGLPGVDVRGFQYDTDSGVPYSTNWTESGAWGIGIFSHSLTPLTSADFYFYRALSANTTVGYGYGSELTFFTKPNEPTGLVCTPGDKQVALTWTKATNGIGATMNTYIRYKIGSYPVDITDGTFSYNGTLSANTTAGLTNGTAYYFVAWSWAYENGLSQWSDVTANCTSTPMGGVAVETHYCSGYSQTTAILNGEVTSLLGVPGVSERGFDYGLTTGYGSSQTTIGSFGVGEFNESINGLEPATLYHFRAKAKSDAGIWAYGADMLFATKGSPTLDEYWNTGGTGYGANITGATWAYQTFTTNSTDVSRSVKSIKLSLLRVSTATGVGTVTVSVRHTSNCTTPLCGGNYCLPTGADIATTTLDGDSFSTSYTWQEFAFTTEECLEANTTYAIVVSAINGDSNNYIRWYWTAAGGYGGGNAGGSTDSGVTWSGSCSSDYLFEVWGNSCLEMEEAKVFTSYINSGDWLITVLYKNFYPPYYEDGADVSSLFYLQLVDGATVKAQSKVPEWGYRPGCIYLSSTMVAPLEWGEAYLVRIYGNFGANPHMDYTLQPTDWMGSDLTRLDSWARSVAARMEAYYSVTLTQYISGKGIVLNENGGVIFATNIPDLDKVRPNLFTIVSTTPGYETGDHTQTYARSLAWQPLVGAQLTRMWTSIGNAFGMSGSSVGSILVFAFYATVVFLAFPPGHAIAAIVIPIPILLFVWGSGLAQLALMAIILAVAIILFAWQFWFKQG